MKQIKSIALASLVALFFTACGGGSSSGGSTPPQPTPPVAETVDISDYFWGKLYTDDESGNFHQVRYETSTQITSPTNNGNSSSEFFYVGMNVYADGTASIHDNHFPVNGRFFKFPHPTELKTTYTPTDNGNYDVYLEKEGNKIVIILRLYDGSELHSEAQYYLEENLGLYKRVFNGEIIVD